MWEGQEGDDWAQHRGFQRAAYVQPGAEPVAEGQEEDESCQVCREDVSSWCSSSCCKQNEFVDMAAEIVESKSECNVHVHVMAAHAKGNVNVM